MIYSILKTINSVKSVSFHLSRFLSASAWSSLRPVISSAETLSADFILNILLFSSSWREVSKYSKQNYLLPHAHLHFSISDLPTVQGCPGQSKDLAFSRFCPGILGFATFVQGFSPINDQDPIYSLPLCGKNEHTTDAMITLWSKQLYDQITSCFSC